MYDMVHQPKYTDSLEDCQRLEGVRLAHLILDMGFGGAEQLVQNITIAMKQQGAQCHIICFDAISDNTEPLVRHGISIELIKRKQTSFDALACLRLLLLEGMAAGRAVVATTVGRMPEIVQPDQSPGNGLLVPPGNPLALSQALSNLLGNETLRLRLGRAARSSVARRYDQQAMCRHYQAVYTQALPKRVAP
jgi:hypothetical protein